jgi:hypothetical protein
MSTVYVTAKEIKSGGCQIIDNVDGQNYGTVASWGDADSLVKDAHNDVGLIVVSAVKGKRKSRCLSNSHSQESITRGCASIGMLVATA